MIHNFLIENIGLILTALVIGVLLLDVLGRKRLFDAYNEIARVEQRLIVTNQTIVKMVSNFQILEREIASCIKFHDELNKTFIKENQAQSINDEQTTSEKAKKKKLH